MPKTLNKTPLTNLPTPDEGTEGLARVADAFGEEAFFKFIGEARDHRGETAMSYFRAALATAMIDAEGSDREETRRIVAERLRYTPKTRGNFYKVDAIGQTLRREFVGIDSDTLLDVIRAGRRGTLDHLPTASEGFDGLIRMVEACGAEETYIFLAWLRDPNSVVGQFRTELAARMVDAAGGTKEAIRAVGDRLGYTGKGQGKTQTRTNWNKLVEAGQLGLTGRYELLKRRRTA